MMQINVILLCMINLQANGKDQEHLGNPEGEDIVSVEVAQTYWRTAVES